MQINYFIESIRFVALKRVSNFPQFILQSNQAKKFQRSTVAHSRSLINSHNCTTTGVTTIATAQRVSLLSLFLQITSIIFNSDAFNGKHFPMELHVVFFKKEYGSMKEATLKSDGLVVMAFFFKISNSNPAYEELSELLATITKPHMTASFSQPLALQDFMLTNLHEYYVYNGSLTTPPCLEV